MKRKLMFFMAVLMLFTSLFPSLAMARKGNEYGVRSIQPGEVNPVHEYRAYETKEAADNAKTTSGPVEGYVENQIIRNGERLEYIEPIEKKDNIFLGWYTEDENGNEYRLTTDPVSVSKDKIFYAYPKYKSVNFVYFIAGDVSRGYADANIDLGEGKKSVSKGSEPAVNKEGHTLTGWYMVRPWEDVPDDMPKMTKEKAKKAGKLFEFGKTVVDGELDLHAIFEPSTRIVFDTQGGSPVPGTDAIDGKVKAPEITPEKPGYTFNGWYLEENQQEGSSKIDFLDINKDGYFDYTFTNETTVKADYSPNLVDYQIIFRIEKLPGTYENEEDKYEYFSYEKINSDSNLLNRGKANSSVKFQAGENNDKVTYIPMETIDNHIENKKNSESQWLGFHINWDYTKTKSENDKIMGDGNTSITIYLDRDSVNVVYYENIYEENDKIKSDDPHIDLGTFKYGENLDVADENKGWKKMKNKFLVNSDQIKQPVMVTDKEIQSNQALILSPYLVYKPSEKSPAQMEKINDTQWQMTIGNIEPFGTQQFIAIPIEAPFRFQMNNRLRNQLDVAKELENNLENNILNESIIENLRLPESRSAIGQLKGKNSTYLNSQDLIEYPGFSGIEMPNEASKNRKGFYGTHIPREDNLRHPKTDQLVKNIFIKDGETLETDPVFTFMFFWDRKEFDLDFRNTKEPEGFNNKVLYDTFILGNPNENKENNLYTLGKPKVNENSLELKKFLDSYTVLKTDNDGIPLNKDKATVNSNGDYFKGWYLDPGFQEPFEPETMKMPAKNLEVFGKWEPINYKVKFHKLYPSHPSANVPDHIIDVIVPEGYQVSEDYGIYELPIGKTKDDFLGWYEKKGKDGDGKDIYEKFHFDTPITQDIDLYPMWRESQIRVVYVMNSKNPNSLTPEELQKIHSDISNKTLEPSTGPWTGEEGYSFNYDISSYQYSMDNPIRLHSPLGYKQEEVIHPECENCPEGVSRDFYGWKVGWMKKSLGSGNIYDGNWDNSNNLYYYNSSYNINTNETTIPAVTGDDFIGMVFFFAQYRDTEEKTSLNIFPNIEGLEDKKLEIEGIKEELDNNEKVTLPEKEEVKALIEKLKNDESLDDSVRENIKDYLETKDMMAFNEKDDGTGRTFNFGESVLVDLGQPLPNNLYIMWKNKVHISLQKIWNPDDGNLPDSINVGLLRRTGTSSVAHPKTDGFLPVPNSLRTIDAENEWEVSDYFDLSESNGVEYYYLVLEVPKGKEEMFKSGYDYERDGELTWSSLGINITKDVQGYKKEQVIKHEVSPDEIDVYTSATTRLISDDGTGKTINFKMTNEKVDIEPPNINQAYNGDEKIIVDVPSDKDIKKMVINVYNGQYEEGKTPKHTFEISKDEEDWKLGDEVLDINDNNIAIPIGDSSELNTDDEIHGQSFKTKNSEEVSSVLDKVTVIPREDSIKAEPPYQERRNQYGEVIIKGNVPEGVDSDAEYFLTTGSDDIVKYILHNGEPLKGIIDPEDSNKIKFVIPLELEEGEDPQIYNGQTLRLVVAEDNKNRSISEESEPLDTEPPKILAEDIVGQVSVPLPEDQGKISISDNTEEGVIVNYDKVPNGLKFVKEATGLWNITGTPTFDIEYGEYVTTVTATDKFGNKSEERIRYTITNLDTLPPPIIKEPKQGDKVVEVKPPENGTKLTVSVGLNNYNLEFSEGDWYNSDTNEKVNLNDKGFLQIPVDSLNQFTVVRATASADGYKDSPEAEDIARPASETGETEDERRTTQPLVEKVLNNSKILRVKPRDNATDIYISYRKADEDSTSDNPGDENPIFHLEKRTGNWYLYERNNGNWEVGKSVRIVDGYLEIPIQKGKDYPILNTEDDTVKLDLKDGDVFSITGKDNEFGKLTSYPVGIGVGLTQTPVPEVEGSSLNEEGKSTITGKGEPDSVIKIYDENDVVIGIGYTDKNGDFTVVVDEKLDKEENVKITQKTGNHPESNPEYGSLISQKEGPIIEPPTEGDTEIIVTPPEDSEIVIINVPGEGPINIEKDEDGDWIDEDGNELERDGNKIKVPTKPIKPGEVTAVGEDKDGNSSEKTKEKVIPSLEKPIIREPHEGDTSVTVIPPKSAEKIEVEIPGMDSVTYEKDRDGNWKDSENNIVARPGDEIVAPTNPLPSSGEITAKATDKNGKKLLIQKK